MADYGAVGGGILLGLFMAISVGPTLFAVIRYSMNHSWKSGVAFVLGVSVSDIMYVTLANLAAPFLEVLHRYERALAYGGGSILIIIGLRGLLAKYKPQRPSQKLTTIGHGHYIKIFISGFLINTINPGVILNWLTAVTIIAAHGPSYRFVFFATCLAIVLGFDFLKVLLADSIRKRLTLRIVMYLNRISAAILFAFGAIIITLTLMGIELKAKEPKEQQHATSIRPSAAFLQRR
jgi:threonine/homoserine/homoserine lactone efflux protein